MQTMLMLLLAAVVTGGAGCATRDGLGPAPVQTGTGGGTPESAAEQQTGSTPRPWVRKTQRIGRRTFVDTYHRE